MRKHQELVAKFKTNAKFNSTPYGNPFIDEFKMQLGGFENSQESDNEDPDQETAL